MMVVATMLGILVPVPIALGAARSIAPYTGVSAVRGIITISPTFQEVIIAILCVAMFGFGPFGGVVALACATIGAIFLVVAGCNSKHQ